MQLPPPLSAAPNVAVVAPSSGLSSDQIQPGLAWLKQAGCTVRTIYRGENSPAYRTDDDRLDSLQAALDDQQCEAIFCARGGFGLSRLLDRLDWSGLQHAPKWLVGFSDTTALHLAVQRHCHLAGASGFLLYPSARTGEPAPATEQSLWATLRHRPTDISGLRCQSPGVARGPLLGGCLSVLCSLLGTPHLPDFRGAVLILEDVGERPYRLDRMLQQMHSAGVFDGVSGILWGHFEDCQAVNTLDGRLRDLFAHWNQRLGVPAASGLQYGHGIESLVVPLGSHVVLDAEAGRLKYT